MKVSDLSLDELARLNALRNDRMWWPQPGPQLDAYQSAADITLYGGAAGAGKTDLALGLSLTSHQKTIIYRSEYPQLAGINDRLEELLGSRDKFSGQDKVWRVNNHCTIELGSFQNPGDCKKYQGRPHDLIIYDECANLREEDVRFTMGWNRSTDPTQRCRILMASNPPIDSDGMWLLDFFAPWLNPDYRDPLNLGQAKHGDLRWFVTVDGKDHEVLDATPLMHNGEKLLPQSRTFIPGRVWDNLYLKDSGYVATLQALPEPLRSAMLHGDFLAARSDDDYQVIPSQWVMEAQARWKPRTTDTLNKLQITSVGCDPARGGADESVLCRRYGWWFDELLVIPGKDTPRSSDLITLLVPYAGGIDGFSPVHIDVIGIGAAILDGSEQYLDRRAIPINAAGKANYKDFTGNLKFANRRAEMWWRLRELLDPDSPVKIALPPDRKLMADLIAPRYSMKPQGILIESKDQIRKRLGRSTDRGDALVLACIRSPVIIDAQGNVSGGSRPRVIGSTGINDGEDRQW